MPKIVIEPTPAQWRVIRQRLCSYPSDPTTLLFGIESNGDLLVTQVLAPHLGLPAAAVGSEVASYRIRPDGAYFRSRPESAPAEADGWVGAVRGGLARGAAPTSQAPAPGAAPASEPSAETEPRPSRP